SVALSFTAIPARREALSREAVAMARRTGDGLALAYALSSLCDAIAGPDHVDERAGAASEIVRLARREGDPEMELLGRRFRVVAMLERGLGADADVEIDASPRVAEPLRQPLYTWYVPLWRGMRAAIRGDLDTADALAVEAESVGAKASSANALMLGETLRGY